MPGLKPIARRTFERFLHTVGCRFERQKGSHRIFSKPGLTRPVVVPARGVIAVSLIASNLRTLGMTPDQYLAILEDM